MKHTLAIGLLAGMTVLGTSASAQTYSYPDFSSVSGLQLGGDASQWGNKLFVTPGSTFTSGSAYTASPVSLAGNASFSSVFTFDIQGPGPTAFDRDDGGLTFSVRSPASGGPFGVNGVSVKFDDGHDGVDPPLVNQVSIDLNANLASIVSTGFLSPNFDNGAVWWAWVDYDGLSRQLDVRWAQSATRPAAAMLTADVDLPTILGGTDAYVGFTAGTIYSYSQHSIDSWEFATSNSPIATPEPASFVLMLTGMGVLGAVARRRRH